MIVSIMFQLFIISDRNITTVSLLKNNNIEYAIAGTPSDRKQLSQDNNSLILQCDATDLSTITMCGIILYIPKDEQTNRYTSLKPYNNISTQISASAESSGRDRTLLINMI